MRRSILLSPLILSLLIGTAACDRDSEDEAPDAELAGRLDPVIDQAIAGKQIVGTVILVARDGKIVYRRAAGFADRESARPMKEDTLFRLASMSKLVTAVAALSLIDDQKLRLDDEVTRWLPTFRPRLPSGVEPPLTIHQLMNHTSGLGYGFGGPEFQAYRDAGVSTGLDQPGLSFEENARRLASVPLLFEPGTQFYYSLSQDVLGGIVALAGGTSFPEVVRQKIGEPVGFEDTGFTVTDESRLATPYADGTPEPVPMGDVYEAPLEGGAIRFEPPRALNPDSYPSGGAGLVGTAGDYLRFLEALRTGTLLKQESRDALFQNQLGELETFPGAGFSYGVGVIMEPEKSGSSLSAGSISWAGAYGGSYWVDPAARLSVVLLFNTAMGGSFSVDVEKAVYGR